MKFTATLVAFVMIVGGFVLYTLSNEYLHRLGIVSMMLAVPVVILVLARRNKKEDSDD